MSSQQTVIKKLEAGALVLSDGFRYLIRRQDQHIAAKWPEGVAVRVVNAEYTGGRQYYEICSVVAPEELVGAVAFE